MPTHLDIYKGILFETDKVKAPVFYIEHYNYVVNKAITRVMRQEYRLSDDEKKPEVYQDDVDGIQVLEREYVAKPKPNSGELKLSDSTFPIPAEYFHLRSCLATFKPVNCPGRSDSERVVRRCTRYTGNIMNQEDDYYARPSFHQVYAQIINNQVKIKFGTPKHWELEKVEGLYVINPELVALEEDANQDIIPTSDKPSQFSRDLCDRIVDESVTILLDIWNNPRLRDQLSIKNNS